MIETTPTIYSVVLGALNQREPWFQGTLLSIHRRCRGRSQRFHLPLAPNTHRMAESPR